MSPDDRVVSGVYAATHLPHYPQPPKINRYEMWIFFWPVEPTGVPIEPSSFTPEWTLPVASISKENG